jgi:hypothetical protein
MLFVVLFVDSGSSAVSSLASLVWRGLCRGPLTDPNTMIYWLQVWRVQQDPAGVGTAVHCCTWTPAFPHWPTFSRLHRGLLSHFLTRIRTHSCARPRSRSLQHNLCNRPCSLWRTPVPVTCHARLPTAHHHAHIASVSQQAGRSDPPKDRLARLQLEVQTLLREVEAAKGSLGDGANDAKETASLAAEVP